MEENREDTHRSALWRDRESELAQALGIAEAFLDRWDDHFTLAIRDDLGLQAAMLAVEALDSLEDRRNFPAFVRTIARRQRVAFVREEARRSASCEVEELPGDVPVPKVEVTRYRVAGNWVSRRAMVRVLPRVLGELSALNARLLLGFYEGFTCVELAARFGLTFNGVKARLHRSRRRVQVMFEHLAQRQQSCLHGDELRSPDVEAPPVEPVGPVARPQSKRS